MTSMSFHINILGDADKSESRTHTRSLRQPRHPEPAVRNLAATFREPRQGPPATPGPEPRSKPPKPKSSFPKQVRPNKPNFRQGERSITSPFNTATLNWIGKCSAPNNPSPNTSSASTRHRPTSAYFPLRAPAGDTTQKAQTGGPLNTKMEKIRNEPKSNLRLLESTFQIMFDALNRDRLPRPSSAARDQISSPPGGSRATTRTKKPNEPKVHVRAFFINTLRLRQRISGTATRHRKPLAAPLLTRPLFSMQSG